MFVYDYKRTELSSSFIICYEILCNSHKDICEYHSSFGFVT